MAHFESNYMARMERNESLANKKFIKLDPNTNTIPCGICGALPPSSLTKGHPINNSTRPFHAPNMKSKTVPEALRILSKYVKIPEGIVRICSGCRGNLGNFVLSLEALTQKIAKKISFRKILPRETVQRLSCETIKQIMSQTSLTSQRTSQIGIAMQGTSQTGVTQQGTSQTGGTQQGISQIGGTQQGTSQTGVTQQGTSQTGGTQQGTSQIGGTQQGTSQTGGTQQGTSQIGGTQQGTSQIGGTQQGTSQIGGTLQGTSQINFVIVPKQASQSSIAPEGTNESSAVESSQINVMQQEIKESLKEEQILDDPMQAKIEPTNFDFISVKEEPTEVDESEQYSTSINLIPVKVKEEPQTDALLTNPTKHTKSPQKGDHSKEWPVKKPFKCDDCQKTFPEAWRLKKHKMIHTGEKPFVCHICMKAFSQSHHLKEHFMNHHGGEKPYTCDFCGRAFATRRILNNHRTIHTGERPFQCNECNKTFQQNGDLWRHKQSHTG